ncbi:hypothetical protein ABL78_1602 [Leptomonas seymouri]|uniref:Uncharacterized protein n=1 Tax=Leptomonas seymouri TaxID=5684 RepID=A0A0N0P7W7_LEPSE|nr:hypothetical protein ABL78_1602 [Leptomonas seymouri]|eukprot:KPI89269.1 hypothetical protein ABL78_1602 [Leptomonas seymouri]
MSTLDISQQDAAASPSPACSPVSPFTPAVSATIPNVDNGAPEQAKSDVANLFSLTSDEGCGLLIVLGVALFQEVHSSVFRGVLAGAAAGAALYSQVKRLTPRR